LYEEFRFHKIAKIFKYLKGLFFQISANVRVLAKFGHGKISTKCFAMSKLGRGLPEGKAEPLTHCYML